MRTILTSILVSSALLIVLSSCHRHYHTSHPHGMPPGQAKKVTGSKSAKPYAPGQRKKH